MGLIKRLKDFHNIHKGSKIVVCGCGMSLLNFKDHHEDFITFGINDAPALFDPTYSIVTDHPNRFGMRGTRQKIVNEAKSKYLFTCVPGWRHPHIVHFELGSKGTSNLDNPELVDHFLNSPYTAINIAYKMGAKNIAMIGVDFTDGHFYAPKDGPHSLSRIHITDVQAGYALIRDELKNRGVNLYNLSKESNIKCVPYMSIENFKEL